MISYIFGLMFILCSFYIIRVTPLAVTCVIVALVTVAMGSVMGSVTKWKVMCIFPFAALFALCGVRLWSFTIVAILYMIAAGVCVFWGCLGLEVVKTNKKREEVRRNILANFYGDMSSESDSTPSYLKEQEEVK